jgi:hypothetical protein
MFLKRKLIKDRFTCTGKHFSTYIPLTAKKFPSSVPCVSNVEGNKMKMQGVWVFLSIQAAAFRCIIPKVSIRTSKHPSTVFI